MPENDQIVNKSKTYFLPYMNDYIPIKFVNRILNTYMFYKEEYKFCILYQFSGKVNFLRYEEELMSNEFYIETVDIGVDKVLYVFEVPQDMFKVIELFLDGKYSYLPDKDKIKMFLTFHFKLRKNHRIFHILDRTEILRKALEEELAVDIPEGLDLASPPDMTTEIFELNTTNNGEEG